MDKDNNVGQDHVHLQEKKEEYREKAEEEAEEDQSSPSYAPILTYSPVDSHGEITGARSLLIHEAADGGLRQPSFLS